MDALDDLLRSLHVADAVYGRYTLRGPWGAGFRIPDACSFHFIEGADCWLTIEGETPARLVDGDLVLIREGRRHTLQDELNSPIVEQGERPSVPTHCAASKNGAATSFTCGLIVLGAHPLATAMPPLLRCNFDRNTEIGVMLRSVVSALGSSRGDSLPGQAALSDQLMGVLLVQLVREHLAADCTDDVAAWGVALRDPQIGRALHRIHKQPERQWSMSALASEAGMSRSAFAARFKAMLKEPPMAYLSRWRILRAAQELRRHPQLSVSEVMSRVGYASEATFSRAFKRGIGMPPAAYRATSRFVSGSS
jgi:AraC-like DNA-binding protein